ncbi:integrator complex subunit [Thraustotheca clavata]|uniref:Integrator complex subunit n=1 Tax=Thraustotheca clavata TaxID=74557 RepID=A0A1V9ZYF6_9STRA|nr:integrator complex subunit [Thraustotheca clavata]
MAPGRPTRSSTARGESLRSAAKAAAQKISTSKPLRSARMKRVVYDESEEDEEESESDAKDDMEEEEEEEEEEEDEEEEEEDDLMDEEEKSPPRKRPSKKEDIEEKVPPPPPKPTSPVKSKSTPKPSPKSSPEKEAPPPPPTPPIPPEPEEQQEMEIEDDEEEEEEDEDLRLVLENEQNEERLVQIINDSLGQLARTGDSPGREISLAYLAAVAANPAKFQAPNIIKALTRMLRSKFQGRERSNSLEKKMPKAVNGPNSKQIPKEPVKSITLAVLVCNLLAKILKHTMSSNVDECLKVFVDDSLNSRAWVDNQMCTTFLELLKSEIATQHFSKEVGTLIMDHLVSKLNDIKKAGHVNVPSTNLKQAMLTLMDLTILPQGRLLASSNLDVWFQNTTYKTIARELLLQCARSCTTLEPTDMETVENLLNMKFKSVSFPQLKTEVFSILVRQRPEYITIAMKVVLAKERLGASVKDVDNLKMMPLIFRETARTVDRDENEEILMFRRPNAPHPGAETSKALAAVLQDMATVPSNLLTLKNTLRKVFKSLNHDQLDVRAFCAGLMLLSPNATAEYYTVMGELVALVLFLQGTAVKSVQVPDASSNRIGIMSSKSSTDKSNRRLLNPGAVVNPASIRKKETPNQGSNPTSIITPSLRAKEELAQLIADVQRMAVNWCHDIQNQQASLGVNIFFAVMKKILFLENQPDSQVTEHDRGCYAFCKDLLPAHETTIIGMVGICYYATPEQALELLRLVEALIVRAAEGQIVRENNFRSAGTYATQVPEYVKAGGLMGLTIERTDFITHLYEVGVVRGHMYDGKSIAYSEIFWLSCTILLILAVFSPSTIGAIIWDEIPTMRCLMQMAITARYNYPPVEPEDSKLYGTEDAHTGNLTKLHQTFIEWELQFLQSNGVQTDGMFLVSTPATSMARAPPDDVLRKIEQQDKSLRFGVRLRQSRSKDFLMNMVDVAVATSWSEAPEQIWWIVEIVCEEQETLTYLPRKCLCELLLLAYVEPRTLPEAAKYVHSSLLNNQVPRLLSRLKECITTDDDGAAIEVLSFFLDRLVSSSVDTRRISSHVLGLLTSNNSPEPMSSTSSLQFDWLLALTGLPSFPLLHARVLSSLENVLRHEPSIEGLKRCLNALYDLFAKKDMELQMAEAVGRLLTERTSVARLLLRDEQMLIRIVETLTAAVAHQANANQSQELPQNWIQFPMEQGAIALPRTVVSGVVEILSSPVAFLTVLNAAYSNLISIFFPENPSIGLLAQPEYVCTPDHLARLACVDNVQLMTAAIRTMPVKSLWDLVLSYGRTSRSMSLQLDVLSKHLKQNEAECCEALVASTRRSSFEEAATETYEHLNMYLRQPAYVDVKKSASCLDILKWLEQSILQEESEDMEISNPVVQNTESIPLIQPVANLDELLAFPSFKTQRQHKRRLSLSTSALNEQACQWIISGTHFTKVIEWIRVVVEPKHVEALGGALFETKNAHLIAAVLDEIAPALINPLMTSLLRNVESWDATMQPLMQSLLNHACRNLKHWDIAGLQTPLLHLILAEQALVYQKSALIDPTRLDLVRYMTFHDKDNIVTVITSLVDAFFNDSYRPIAQTIIMDLYGHQPHVFGMHMDVCFPGWQYTYDNVNNIPVAEDGKTLDVKLDEWLHGTLTKETTATLRRTALQHPLLVCTKVTQLIQQLNGAQWHTLSEQWSCLENVFIVIESAKSYVFSKHSVLEHVVHASLYILDAVKKHGDKELDHPVAHHFFKWFFLFLHEKPEVMTPLLFSSQFQDEWKTLFADAESPNSTYASYLIQCLEEGECCAIATPPTLILSRETPIRDVETQLETFKLNFETTHVLGVKSYALPALCSYAIAQPASLSKKAVGLLCQCLILAMQSDILCAAQATEAFIACLKSSKVGLREAAMLFLGDFLVYCDPYSILSLLFMDDSDVSKSSIAQYFKTELYKTWHD